MAENKQRLCTPDVHAIHMLPFPADCIKTVRDRLWETLDNGDANYPWTWAVVKTQADWWQTEHM